MSKKPLPKWWLVPPVVAVLLILGPLSMQSPAAPASTPPSTQSPASAPTETARPERTIALPRTPDFWQIGSTLLGVLVLGAAGVFGLRRLRGGVAPTRGATIVTLRQSLRLAARATLHAVEFDDRILLVGESDKGLVMLDAGRSRERAADELEAIAAAEALLDAVPTDDDGAVPKNLVIPRPEVRPAARLPRQPVLPREAAARTPAAAAPRTLADFRALLQKAGRA